MDFVVVDVETANPDLASICQIGVVGFGGGAVVSEWQSLVDPEDYFDPWNVAVHGIRDVDIHGAPTVPHLFPDLQRAFEGAVVACHTPFDRVALDRAAAKYGLTRLECTWLDTANVVRRAWPQFSRSGYGLASITAALGIEFEHHVAQEDARAAGQVLLHAIAETGLSVTEWLHRTKQPISPDAGQLTREGNPDGPLAGETIVFTGAMSLPRRQAADLAAEAGCTVIDSVNRLTTLLVVGDQDLRRLAGHQKSTKHRKAEQLIAKGQSIRVLKESDFLSLVRLS